MLDLSRFKITATSLPRNLITFTRESPGRVVDLYHSCIWGYPRLCTYRNCMRLDYRKSSGKPFQIAIVEFWMYEMLKLPRTEALTECSYLEII